MDKQGAQGGITLLADRSQLVLAAAGVLTRHQAEPGRKLPGAAKLLCIAHGCDDGRGADWTDAFNFHQPLAALITAGLLLQHLVELTQALVVLQQLILQLFE
jgi:hypothetical protein